MKCKIESNGPNVMACPSAVRHVLTSSSSSCPCPSSLFWLMFSRMFSAPFSRSPLPPWRSSVPPAWFSSRVTQGRFDASKQGSARQRRSPPPPRGDAPSHSDRCQQDTLGPVPAKHARTGAARCPNAQTRHGARAWEGAVEEEGGALPPWSCACCSASEAQIWPTWFCFATCRRRRQFPRNYYGD